MRSADQPASAALYQRLGFVHLGELGVPGQTSVLAHATTTGSGLGHADEQVAMPVGSRVVRN